MEKNGCLSLDAGIAALQSLKVKGISGDTALFIPSTQGGAPSLLQRASTVSLSSIAKPEFEKGWGLCKYVTNRGVPVVVIDYATSADNMSIDGAIAALQALKDSGTPGGTPLCTPSVDNNGRSGFFQRVEGVGQSTVIKSDFEKGWSLCKLATSRGVTVVLMG